MVLTELGGDRAAAKGDTWLAEKLAKYASDETRHGQIFAHALQQVNKQVIDFNGRLKQAIIRELAVVPSKSESSILPKN